MYLKKCLLHIKERLGPVTKELGLRHTLGKGHDDDICLFFDRRDENGILWRSMLSFTFPPARLTPEKELSWQNVRLGIDVPEVISVGTNGWIHYVNEMMDLEGTALSRWVKGGPLDAVFDIAAGYLREHPLVPERFDLPKIVSLGDFGQLWRYLEPELRKRGVETVDVSRPEEWVEVYSFEFEGHRAEIIFQLETAALLIDGVVVHKGTSYNDSDKLIRTLSYLMDDMLDPTSDGGRFALMLASRNHR
ncbi:hypothetical protein ACWGPT_09455 [Pseudorhizobium sp. NPDC055634]